MFFKVKEILDTRGIIFSIEVDKNTINSVLNSTPQL